MGDPILFLSDSPEERSSDAIHNGVEAVRGRPDAARILSERALEAICIDRRKIEDALSDARWLRRRRNQLPVIAIADAEQMNHAVELLDHGVEELVVRDASSRDAVRQRLEGLDRRRHRTQEPRATEQIIASSPAMRICLEYVEKAQRSSASVLLQGETGSGKEVIARSIHRGGLRAPGSFVAINCAAFPETLLESELFGHERGAFTGATRPKPGHFEQADGGTLFLDEIGETTLAFQVKLLRVLQEGTVRPLGATSETQVDVRIIAATNRDLQHEVEVGRFRRDLFYRLNVFPIALPPLRVRAEDVIPLARLFLERHRGADTPCDIAPDAARLLETHTWPGNVRELENEVARIVASVDGESLITARMLSGEIRGRSPSLPPDPSSETLRQTMARFEAWVLRRALDRHGQRRIATARSLGITRECLYKKLKRYGMQ
ncbi:MAG: AAA domain-containing protein [bacterium]|nr:AAA domain-containing protein [bacterium]